MANLDLDEAFRQNEEAISKAFYQADALLLGKEFRDVIGDFANDIVTPMKGIAIIVNREGNIVFCNRLFCKMLGMYYKDVRKTPFADYLHPEDREATVETYEHREENQRPTFFNRYRSAEKGWQWIAWPPATTEYRELLVAVGYMVEGVDDPFCKRWEE